MESSNSTIAVAAGGSVSRSGERPPAHAARRRTGSGTAAEHTFVLGSQEGEIRQWRKGRIIEDLARSLPGAAGVGGGGRHRSGGARGGGGRWRRPAASTTRRPTCRRRRPSICFPSASASRPKKLGIWWWRGSFAIVVAEEEAEAALMGRTGPSFLPSFIHATRGPTQSRLPPKA